MYLLCAEHGVPASEVLLVDTSQELIDRDYMVVRYIPSNALSQVELCPEDQDRIVRDIGDATAKLYSITAAIY